VSLTGDIYPLESIESPETRAAMREADVIFGFDISREKDVLMFGRQALKAVVESGAPTPLRIVRIKYDQRTGDSLEYLVAAVRAIKGHDDYNRAD
jgi:hypothetical protein